MTTLSFTDDELNVLTALVEFHVGNDIPEWMSIDAYNSVIDKIDNVTV